MSTVGLPNQTDSRSATIVSGTGGAPRCLHSFPTRRSSDLDRGGGDRGEHLAGVRGGGGQVPAAPLGAGRSEEHTSELQSLRHLVCRLLLEKKNRPKAFRARPPAPARAPRPTCRRPSPTSTD